MTRTSSKNYLRRVNLISNKNLKKPNLKLNLSSLKEKWITT
jgi:hypothetical protein